MTEEPDFGLWQGLTGGVHDGPFVGAYMIDADTGQRSQIEEVLEDGWVQVRQDDGAVATIKVRRPSPDELRMRREADGVE